MPRMNRKVLLSILAVVTASLLGLVLYSEGVVFPLQGTGAGFSTYLPQVEPYSSESIAVPELPVADSGEIVEGNSVSEPAPENDFKSIHMIEDELHQDEIVSLEPSGRSYTAGQTVEGTISAYTPPHNDKLNRDVFGFAPYWNFQIYTQAYEWDKLSIIGFFSLTCGDNGEWYYDDAGWNMWNSAYMDQVIATAHANGVKVVPVVKNFDRYSIRRLVDYYDECDTDPVNCPRQFLIRRVLDQITNKNVDGVNVDFEYFASETYPVDDKLRADFVSFMDELADRVHALRPGSHVSVDTIASAGAWYTAYDVAGFGSSSVDSLLVMAYDFHSTNSVFAAPVSPLYGEQYWYTVAKSMQDISAVVSPSKILMGVPYYGLEFHVDPWEWPWKNATRIGAGGTVTYSYILKPEFDPWHNASTLYWDEGEKMRWYSYGWTDPVNGPDYWEGYYDDQYSLAAKYDFVNDMQLGGIGIWALGYDYGHEELWDTIRDNFSIAEFVVSFRPGISTFRKNQITSAVGAQVVRNHPVNSNFKIVRPVSRLSVDVMNDYRRYSEVLGVFYSVNDVMELSDFN